MLHVTCHHLETNKSFLLIPTPDWRRVVSIFINLSTAQNSSHSTNESNCEINWLNLSLLGTKTPIYKYFQQLSSCDLNSVLLVYRTVYLRSFYFIVIWYEFVYRSRVYLIVHNTVHYCQYLTHFASLKNTYRFLLISAFLSFVITSDNTKMQS